jgi:hypothetical protein
MKNFRRGILAMLLVLSLTTVVAWAQEDAPEKGDPPGRAARLQYMSGSVSIQPGGTGDWAEGSLNRPLTNSDNIWSDKSSRAELNVGTGVLRMSDETSLTLTNVNDNSVQVQLHQGTLNVHVRHLFGGEMYEVDTPNMAFTIQKSGDYRFDVDPNGDATVVTVRKGEGDATGQGPGVRVHSDQQVRFTDGTSMTHAVAEAPSYDGFDSWCAVRDKRLDSSLSARYVAEGTVGYEDLDDNGVWTEEPPYGHVWVPAHVAPGWAPYQFGHWVWVAPWGWTWVDDAPWGYAPFHYGRWVYGGGYWGWAPGPLYARPVYAPALVAWFGGPGWGASFGFGVGGGYGWCPLGWGEPFFPWYGGGRGYFRNVNIANTRITNINNYYGHPPNRFGQGSFHYANAHAPGGFTAVPSRTLANGMQVRGTAIRVSARDLANAPMGRVNVAPTRNGMLGAHAGQPASMPPARSGMRPVVSRTSPSGGFGRGAGTPMGGMSGQKPSAGRTESSPLTPSRIIPHGPESASGPVPSPALRGVPRPPTSNVQRPAMGNAQITRSVPRPTMGNTPESNGARGGFSAGPVQRSVPRPPAGFNSRVSQPGTMQGPQSRTGMEPSRNRPSTAVPRPTGPVRPASQYNQMRNGGNGGSSRQPSYSPSNRGGYGSSPRYSESPRYSAPPSSRGSAPSYHQSAPSYRGGGGSPSYHQSAPSYHGGGGGSPSYHGGGGGSAPSSHGGGGGGSSAGHGSSGGHSGPR